MKNKLTDLNNHLFAALERLGEENLTKDQLELEEKRVRAIGEISGKILHIAEVSLKAEKLKADFLGNSAPLPELFHSNKEK